jgi:hypothetical protein
MVANLLQRVRLRFRRPTDEEYVEICRNWLRHDKTGRVALLLSIALATIPLALMGRQFFAIMGFITQHEMAPVVFIVGFFFGVLFGCVFFAVIWNVTLLIAGYPQKRARELMLRFHDELARRKAD